MRNLGLACFLLSACSVKSPVAVPTKEIEHTTPYIEEMNSDVMIGTVKSGFYRTKYVTVRNPTDWLLEIKMECFGKIHSHVIDRYSWHRWLLILPKEAKNSPCEIVSIHASTDDTD